MKRVLRSAETFDRKLGNLFETLAGREDELQGRVNQVIKGLLDGSTTTAPQHHPSDDTCCLPLIDDYVVVFVPDQATLRQQQTRRHENFMDFPDATRFDLLDIEEEDTE
jgi:hypothetical protein